MKPCSMFYQCTCRTLAAEFYYSFLSFHCLHLTEKESHRESIGYCFFILCLAFAVTILVVPQAQTLLHDPTVQFHELSVAMRVICLLYELLNHDRVKANLSVLCQVSKNERKHSFFLFMREKHKS